MSATAAVAAEGASETAPVEGDPALETEEVPAEAPAEGEPAPEGEKPEPTPEETAQAAALEAAKAKPAEITEEALQAAARKYANQTMAAARRAEARIEATKTENVTLKESVKVYEGFIEELRTNPAAAIKRIGYAGIREFIDRVRDAGEVKEPTAADEIKALREERRAEKEAAARQAAEARVAEAQTKVYAAIDADKARWARTATKRGHADLWDAIVAYHDMHGDVPDSAVHLLADEVEKDLRQEFGEPIPVQRQDATKPGAPAAAAATAGRNSGKTLTNKQTSGAPATRELSLDPEERRRQVNEEMRAAGELG